VTNHHFLFPRMFGLGVFAVRVLILCHSGKYLAKVRSDGMFRTLVDAGACGFVGLVLFGFLMALAR
jgi:hypothetical protein